nr:immunoglobulin heavy chain junction region [Macaca mulatta]MOV90879.1 immunoglobulin heavy chain junction region [Macaca mulatta]MOV91811.1 immunoglobulin heavy chain junction region [Macaca mulatta]
CARAIFLLQYLDWVTYYFDYW